MTHLNRFEILITFFMTILVIFHWIAQEFKIVNDVIMSTIIWHLRCYKEHPPSNIYHAEAINCKGVYPIFFKIDSHHTKTCYVILVHFWWYFWICDLITKCNVLTSLRGYCTPNLKLACFVCYLKIINPFFEKWCILLKWNSKMALKF